MQSRSLSFDAALADLARLLLRVALAQSVPQALEEDLPERSRIVALGAALDAESVQLYYQIALQGREDLALAPDEHAGFVMTLLRMLAFRPEGMAQALPQPQGGAKKTEPRKPVLPAASVENAPTAAATNAPAGDWPQLVQQLQVTGAARELARNAERRSGDSENLFDLVVPKAKAYLADRNYQDKLKAALEKHLGTRIGLKVSVAEAVALTAAAIEAGDRDAKQAEATQAVQSDGFVQDLVNLFDGKVVDSTIRRNEE
jgi:DNA polymerase-3 subunit gamma/tau